MRFTLASLLLAVVIGGSHALVAPKIAKKLARTDTVSPLPMVAEVAEQQEESVSDAAANVASSAIAFAGDLKSQLASAFMALDENDQYDAVLTGLCAKILDDEDTSSDKVLSALQDPISLLNEMNLRRIKASPRSLMSLIDATVKTEKATAMADILSLCLKNGGLDQYGKLQATLTPMPSAGSQSRVLCPDGRKKTRQERLDDLAKVPTDDRGTEVAAGLAFGTFVGVCGLCSFFHMDDVTPYTNLLLTGLLAVGAVDNFYDVVKFGAGLLQEKTPDNVDVDLPEKEEMPLSLGTGQVTGTVVRGLSRLLSVDTERECQCEAASFYAAYMLGLPCFAFRPNALEAAVLVVESMKNDSTTATTSSLDPLLSDVGMMKLLVWLMAPVAMESSKHAQLIVSDPRSAQGLLSRLEDKADLLGKDLIWWKTDRDEDDDNKECQDLLKWAYAEADLLLRSNKQVVSGLSERLAGGAATMGDCVAVVENW